MKKKLISLVLAMVMVTMLFAGCSKKEATTDSAATADTSTTDTATADTTKSTEIVKLKMAMFAAGDVADAKLIEDAVNAIAREKIGAEAEITFINFGSWLQQTNLILSGGEQLDIMPTLMQPLATYVTNGQVLPLDDLLAKYGAGITANIPQNYIDCGKVNNVLYGVTTNRDLAASFGFTMRKDLADKYGIDPAAIKTLDDVEKALLVIKQNEPDLYPLVPQANAMIASSWDMDQLGDQNWLGVLLKGGASLDVVNYYDSDDYKQFVTTMRKWYEEGLIMPDTLNNTETGNSIVKNGKAFGYLSNTKPGFAAQETRAAGIEMVTVEIVPAFATTSNVSGIVWTIPSNAANPEKAMEFMNLMYSDEAISNLLIYGIQDKHYKVLDAATKMIDYADGVDATNSGYPGGTGWGWPNQFLGYVWNGNPADYWQQMDTFNKTATPSKALGFTFDSTNVATEMAACTNVVSQYNNALRCGALDPVETLPKFNKELEDAGLQKIIDEKQKQLDAWAATQQ